MYEKKSAKYDTAQGLLPTESTLNSDTCQIHNLQIAFRSQITSMILILRADKSLSLSKYH